MKDKFESFIDNEYQKALNYIKKQHSNKSSMDPEDILQEALLTTWEIISKGNIIDNITSYIYRSIKNKIIDIHRKKQTNVELGMENIDNKSYLFFDYIKNGNKDILNKIEKKDFKRIYQDSLNQLSEKYRKVWSCIEIKNLTYEELSQKFSISKNNLRVIKYRANEKLKKIILKKMKGEIL